VEYKQREIKFRGWYKEFGEMCESSFGGHYISFGGKVYNGSTVPDIILMQYTGLKDENDKEIYEGDVIIIPDTLTEPVLDDASGPEIDFNHLLAVTFKEGAFGVEIPHSQSNYFMEGFYSLREIILTIGRNEIKKIGNIYKNPELLERF
jgi:uncharacterized phage protein (TIGR01671 family)